MADAVNIVKEISEFAATEVAPGFTEIGQGIGAIILLVVIVYYCSSILDGGKFQMKMLVPLLIFIIVCNFTWVSRPMLSFASTLTESLVETIDGKKQEIMMDLGCSPTANYHDAHNRMMNSDVAEDETLMNSLLGGSERTDGTNNDDPDDNSTGEVGESQGFIARHVKRGLHGWGRQSSYNIQKELAGEKYSSTGSQSSSSNRLTSRNLSFESIISSIVSWLCNVFSYVRRAFGRVLSGIIVAFGPITFAFAIFPGEGGRIKNWIIRIIQFAMWAPVVSLVDCFSTKIFYMMAEAYRTLGEGGGSSFLMTIAVCVCNFVALTSVPTIAALVVEGAMEGAVSLSQGLQTVGSGILSGLSGGATLGSMVVGKDRTQAMKDTFAGARNMGVVGMAKDLSQNGHSFKGMLGRMQASGRASRIGR